MPRDAKGINDMTMMFRGTIWRLLTMMVIFIPGEDLYFVVFLRQVPLFVCLMILCLLIWFEKRISIHLLLFSLTWICLSLISISSPLYNRTPSSAAPKLPSSVCLSQAITPPFALDPLPSSIHVTLPSSSTSSSSFFSFSSSPIPFRLIHFPVLEIMEKCHWVKPYWLVFVFCWCYFMTFHSFLLFMMHHFDQTKVWRFLQKYTMVTLNEWILGCMVCFGRWSVILLHNPRFHLVFLQLFLLFHSLSSADHSSQMFWNHLSQDHQSENSRRWDRKFQGCLLHTSSPYSGSAKLREDDD